MIQFVIGCIYALLSLPALIGLVAVLLFAFGEAIKAFARSANFHPRRILTALPGIAIGVATIAIGARIEILAASSDTGHCCVPDSCFVRELGTVPRVIGGSFCDLTPDQGIQMGCVDAGKSDFGRLCGIRHPTHCNQNTARQLSQATAGITISAGIIILICALVYAICGGHSYDGGFAFWFPFTIFLFIFCLADAIVGGIFLGRLINEGFSGSEARECVSSDRNNNCYRYEYSEYYGALCPYRNAHATIVNWFFPEDGLKALTIVVVAVSSTVGMYCLLAFISFFATAFFCRGSDDNPVLGMPKAIILGMRRFVEGGSSSGNAYQSPSPYSRDRPVQDQPLIMGQEVHEDRNLDSRSNGQSYNAPLRYDEGQPLQQEASL